MSIRAKASIQLKFQSQQQLASLLDALTPEAKAPVTRRANVQLKHDGACLILSVEADDTIALRSTLNAYLRWINSTVNVLEILEHS
jgi:tRNA threonylcarbamoyladenosine modification (KEOPS) complex  Pcc1 subunit